MRIFIDSANIEEIKKYKTAGLCHGVTTNPTICLKDGVIGMEGVKARIQEIAQLIYPHVVSVEVSSEDDYEIRRQAHDYAALAENIAVKVTITDRSGRSLLPIIHQLVKEGIRINVTAMTTFNQMMFAALSIHDAVKENPARKPHFISIFAGRISEEQGVERAAEVIRDTRRWLELHQIEGIEIIVGSIRVPENVEYWSKAGGHIMTVTPQILEKCLVSARTKETVIQFIEDSKKSSV